LAINAMAARREAARRRATLKKYQANMDRVSARDFTALQDEHRAQSAGLNEYIQGFAGANNLPMAQADEAGRQSRVAGLTGPDAVESASGPGDPYAQARQGAQAYAGGTNQLQATAASRARLLAALQQAQDQRGANIDTQTAIRSNPLAYERYRNEMEREQLRRQLGNSLGSYSQAAANMQLVGGLAQAGGAGLTAYSAGNYA
jgi:hypothetical protein